MDCEHAKETHAVEDSRAEDQDRQQSREAQTQLPKRRPRAAGAFAAGALVCHHPSPIRER